MGSGLATRLLIQMKKEYADRFKFSLFDMGMMLLISFASVAGNFQWKRIYWLAEMPVFIFVLALSVLGAVFLFLKGPRKIKWGVADYLVIFYFVYLVTRALITYYPGLPTDRIWIIIASFLFPIKRFPIRWFNRQLCSYYSMGRISGSVSCNYRYTSKDGIASQL
jgi:hypothetical protein